MNAEKYTRKTLEAFRASQTLAQEQSHQYITPEHLFYALLDQDEGLIPSIALGEVLSFNDKNLTVTVRMDGGIRTVRLGDRIRIRVVSANVSTGKVEFGFIGYSSFER